MIRPIRTLLFCAGDREDVLDRGGRAGPTRW